MTKSGRDFPGAFISLLNTYTSPFPPEVWSSSHASSCPSRDRIHSGCNVWRMERALPGASPGRKRKARGGTSPDTWERSGRRPVAAVGQLPWAPRPTPMPLVPRRARRLNIPPRLTHTLCHTEDTRRFVHGESQASKLLSRNTQVPKQGEPNPLACLLAWRKSIWRRECRRTYAHLRSRPDSSGNIHRLSSCWSSCSA